VGIIERAIKNSSKAGDVVLDLFGGSGSTLVGCEQTGRISFTLEIEPQYADVICTRWQNLTGKQATLEGSGLTFEKIKETRPLEAVNA
jgi:DNA modification methylase